MSYSPRRVLPGGLRPEETRAISKTIVSLPPRQVKSNHLSTHFHLTGDIPQSYASTLGKTTTSGLAEFISSASPTKDSFSSSSSSSSSSSATGYKDRNMVSQINYTTGHNIASPSKGSTVSARKELIYDPKIMSRTEIRNKMNTPHIDFRGPQRPTTTGGELQPVHFENQPVDEPRIPSTYGHTSRSYQHLRSGFEIYDMEPRNKELLSRTQPKKRISDSPTTVRIIDGPAPGEYTRICHDRKQHNLGSSFALG